MNTVDATNLWKLFLLIEDSGLTAAEIRRNVRMEARDYSHARDLLDLMPDTASTTRLLRELAKVQVSDFTLTWEADRFWRFTVHNPEVFSELRGARQSMLSPVWCNRKTCKVPRVPGGVACEHHAAMDLTRSHRSPAPPFPRPQRDPAHAVARERLGVGRGAVWP